MGSKNNGIGQPLTKVTTDNSITTSDKVIYHDISAGEIRQATVSALGEALNLNNNNVTTTTANYILTTANRYLLCDTTSGDISVTLPDAANLSGTVFTVKKTVTANQVTVQGTGGDTIDSSATSILAAGSRGFVEVVSDGSNWFIIGA